MESRMQGDFGSNAGPRGAPHEPLPAVEGSVPHPPPHRPMELSANKVGDQSGPDPEQNSSPPSGGANAREVPADAELGSTHVRRAELLTDAADTDIGSSDVRRAELLTNAKEVADLGLTGDRRAELSKQTRVPTQVFPSVVSRSKNQTTSSHTPAGKRRKISPQTSHMIEGVTQKYVKRDDLKAPPSRHAVENSGASSSQPLAGREEEAKARRLVRLAFGEERNQPFEPVCKAESSKQQDDVDFSEASAVKKVFSDPWVFTQHMALLGHALSCFLDDPGNACLLRPLQLEVKRRRIRLEVYIFLFPGKLHLLLRTRKESHLSTNIFDACPLLKVKN